MKEIVCITQVYYNKENKATRCTAGEFQKSREVCAQIPTDAGSLFHVQTIPKTKKCFRKFCVFFNLEFKKMRDFGKMVDYLLGVYQVNC